MIGSQIMPPRHLVDRHTGHQRLRHNTALKRIRPITLARGSNQNLHAASVLHMVLYMSYQRRLRSKSTLENGLADQTASRKVGSKHHLRQSTKLRRFYKGVSLAHCNHQGAEMRKTPGTCKKLAKGQAPMRHRPTLFIPDVSAMSPSGQTRLPTAQLPNARQGATEGDFMLHT